MSIFGSIMSKIFGTEAKAGTAPATASSGGSSSGASSSGPSSRGATTASANPAAPAQSGGTAAGGNVDVEAIMTDLAKKSGQPSNWRTSIVDLMKLLGLDSSLAARKELAKELGYSGDTSDSATMNIWLHKQVMTKLAANGGKVPDDLKNA